MSFKKSTLLATLILLGLAGNQANAMPSWLASMLKPDVLSTVAFGYLLWTSGAYKCIQAYKNNRSQAENAAYKKDHATWKNAHKSCTMNSCSGKSDAPYCPEDEKVTLKDQEKNYKKWHKQRFAQTIFDNYIIGGALLAAGALWLGFGLKISNQAN